MTEEEQEAATWKYHSPIVVPLTSGRFAVYAPFSNSEGLVFAQFATQEELPHVLKESLASYLSRPVRVSTPPTPTKRSSSTAQRRPSLTSEQLLDLI